MVQGCITKLSSKDFHSYCTQLIWFKERLAKSSDLAKFWLNLLEIIEILFNLIYATRLGNQDLYVESLRKTLPWFFVYDRQNYRRFLTIRFQELLSLESCHPNVYEEFQKGIFSVLLSDNITFGRMENDYPNYHQQRH